MPPRASKRGSVTRNSQAEKAASVVIDAPIEIKGKDCSWWCKEQLGAGSFGTVYLAEQTTKKEWPKGVAVKCESGAAPQPQLKREGQLMMQLDGNEGFPKAYYNEKVGENQVLVMDLLGIDLDQLMSVCGGKFNVVTTCLVGMQMIDRLETMHKKGFLHKDVKPENFLIGRGDLSNTIHVIDLGLSSSYIDEVEKTHNPLRQDRPLAGTIRYASLNAHRGTEQSRRDDLESLAFMLIYFLRGSLPWQVTDATELQTLKTRVKDIKTATDSDDLVEGFPQMFADLLDDVRKIKYDEEPDYNKFRKMLSDCLQEKGVAADAKFEWVDLLPDWVSTAMPKGTDAGEVPRPDPEEAKPDADDDDAAAPTDAKSTNLKENMSFSDSASVYEADADGVGLLARIEQQKVLKKEKGSAKFEFFLDAFDAGFKTFAFVSWLTMKNTQTATGKVVRYETEKGFLVPLIINVTIAVCVTLMVTRIRMEQIKEMNFIVKHGYSYKWKKGEKVLSDSATGQDPRMERDAKLRVRKHQETRAMQAILVDLPWVVTNVIRGASSDYGLGTIGVLAIAVAGFGFGMKFANVIALLKAGVFKKQSMYTSVPAEIRIGVGCSHNKNVEKAIDKAFHGCVAEMGDGKDPSAILIFMTAQIDHKFVLKKLESFAPGIPYSGCTLCWGCMMGATHRKQDMHTIAVWGIHDPEGAYFLGMADMNQVNPEKGMTAREVTKKAAKKTMKKIKQRCAEDPENPIVQGKPSFIWTNPPPGPEDEVLEGLVAGIGLVDIIGGSSADNDVTGQWKQWNSEEGVSGGNSVAFMVAFCSAQVKGCAFTGYSATPKTGMVTEVAGPRHIKTIDGRAACDVYNEWTSGHFNDQMAEAEDSNILGPSSVFPLGQVVSLDWDNEPMYRTMHPHLMVKKDKSLTLFSDVAVGQDIINMTGTRDNIINRISAVALHIQRSTGIPCSEFRGALVVFCAGAMMYCGDGMDQACAKLDASLGGVNYLGIHTFGEQGPFPDGSNRHGNLMFSAMVFTSRRRVMKLSNIDKEEFVLETDPSFEEIAANGGIVGGSGA